MQAPATVRRASRLVPRGSFVTVIVFVFLAALAESPASARAAAAPDDLLRAQQRIAERFASRGVAYPPQAVALVALKSEGRLELWADGGAGFAFVRSYLVQATSGRLGPKLRQGDHQVPEGVYRVSALNPRSRYHLALRLDYPNAFDLARGAEDGRATLGGDIMIHGDRVSDGCLPVGNEAIEELFALATQVGIENVSVVITPLDLRRVDAVSAAARVSRPPRWLGSLYGEIARTLGAFPLAGDGDGTIDPLVTPALVVPRCQPYDAADCERRCADGDVASCGRAGILLRDGRGVAPDAGKAWTLLDKACRGGDAVGCGALSELVVADDGQRRDAGLAAALASRACEAGDGHGCARLASLCSAGLLYPSAPGACDRDAVERLRIRAVARLQKGCRGWAAYDCFTLATIYASGDAATAQRFAAGSCQAGDPGGCDELGALYEQSGELVRARDLYERACGAGYARACRRVARAAATTLAAGIFGGG